MAGTKDGGKQGARTLREKYGEDYFRKLGQKGGRVSSRGGFAANHERAVAAGAKGGAIGGKRGRRGYKLIEVLEDGELKYRNLTTGEIEFFQPKEK